MAAFFIAVFLCLILPGTGCGFPDHQFGMKQHCAYGYSVHQAVQRVIPAFSKLDPVLADRGQRRRRVRTDRNVIKSNDADITGDLISKLLALGDCGAGKGILTADHGGHSRFKKTWKVLFHTF